MRETHLLAQSLQRLGPVLVRDVVLDDALMIADDRGVDERELVAAVSAHEVEHGPLIEVVLSRRGDGVSDWLGT